jgi:5-methylcytosine-specific restriction endonuclease McrA
MSHLYKEARFCECGYNTLNRSNWCTHTKRCQRHVSVNHIESELRERVASLEQQLAAALERNAALEQMVGQQLLEVKEELKQTKKRKDRYAEVAVSRRPLSEPERRRVAQGQGWRCADPDGGCLLPGELQEFDIDHVTPMWKGGPDEPENLQALCPACHRRKTNRERLERSNWNMSNVATAGVDPIGV